MPAIGVALAAAAAIAIVLAGSRMSAQASLFSVPLHPTQVLEVERALTIWNEPFVSDPGRTQIFVSASRRRDVLLRLTLAGLPHRYVPTTADVLGEEQNAFMSPIVADDRRRAGIEGDLVAGLRRMSGVADASVVIAPAVDDPLSDNGRAQASASVQLVMQSGSQLSATAASGIKRFVAASYPGLTADRVVVVDGFGVAASAQATLDKGASRESRLQNSIQSALDAVFGVGAAIVRVSLRTIGEDRSAQSTRVTPHGVLEADTGREHGSENGRRFERDRDRRRYAYDTITETRTSHADAVARVAVAVFLDARKIKLEQSSLVSDLVRAAAGAELSSGDEVVVHALPFAQATAPNSGARPGSRLRALIAGACVAACIASLYAFIVRPRVQARSQAAPTVATAMHGVLQRELPQTAAYVLSSMPPRVRDQVLREYPVDQRERILRHLNGRARGG